MIFNQLFDEKSHTYTYIISSGKGREALIIDPVIEKTNEYLNILKNLELKLVKVIDTHTNSLVQLDKYIGMGSHSVILGLDSQFYMHMHPLGTISMSAQESFMHGSNENFVCDFGLIEENGKYEFLGR